MKNLNLDRENVKKILVKIGWVATAVILAVVAILSYLDSQGVPTESGDVLLFARPTTVVTSATPKPPRTTPTLNVATATPTQTSMLTQTPGGTATPALPTATPVAGDPCSHWHPYGPDLRYPSLGAFDVGYNPCNVIPVFGAILEDYLLDQNVDGFPQSSTEEEKDGYTWTYVRLNAQGKQDQLIAPGEGCALFDNDPGDQIPDRTCITNLLMRLHTTGENTHAKKRNHSIIVFARVCAIGASGKPVIPCGFVQTAGNEDWGIKHQPYKTAFCYDATSPTHYLTGETYPLSLVGQPPYVALQPARGPYAHQLISTITFNPVVEDYYHTIWFPQFPNHLIRTTWGLLDAKEIYDCAEMEPIPTGLLATQFIVHAVTLANLPTERPFVGYTNQNGYVEEACTEIGFTCFPLVITEDVPLGTPFMSFPVQMDGINADGTLTGVIVQDYGP